MEYVGPDKEFINFSDFTIAACRYLIELDYIQLNLEVLNTTMELVLGPEKSKIPILFETIDFECKENVGPKTKTLITFPAGLITKIATFALDHGLPYTDVIRYALEYYYRQIKNRKEAEIEIKKNLDEAYIEAYKQVLEHRQMLYSKNKNQDE